LLVFAGLFASTLTASATITVSISPTVTTVSGGGSQLFTATVTGDSSGDGVTWSIGTGIGTLYAPAKFTVTYYAPNVVPTSSNVTLTATSVANTSVHASETFSVPVTAPASAWVYYNGSNVLTYKTLTNSDNSGSDGYDQIMDFSSAGYEGGNAAIPAAPTNNVANVSASGDTTGATDTAAIQAAINTISGDALSSGFRGTVLLAAGNYYVKSSLTISASGVVLKGAGDEVGDTVITMVANATTAYPFLVIAGTGSPAASGSSESITDAYVPAGATIIHVNNPSNFTVGESVLVKRPITSNWVSYLGMTTTDLGGTEVWLTPGSTLLSEDRNITAINGSAITLDVPVSDSIDSTYVPGATLLGYTFTGRISNVALEYVRVIAPPVLTGGVGGIVNDPSYQLVTMTDVINGWVHDVIAQDTLESVAIGTYTKDITVSNVDLTHTVTQEPGTGALFEEFSVAGTQVLFDTVRSTADNQFFFVTDATTQGPNVLRNSAFTGNENIEPHQRWATGLLIENTTITGDSLGQGSIYLRNRGDLSDQGWTIGWGVVWNSTGDDLAIQMPEGSENWCIGSTGTQLSVPEPGPGTTMPYGIYESLNAVVSPASLYQAQLNQRLGLP